MNINWNLVYADPDYSNVKKSKDFIYDMIIGELNRISVSDDFEEKLYLLSCLKNQIEIYYDKSVECTKILHKYLME